ncbi:uncharacterized protein [Zea mays]|nr:uncharacterized protein LOC103647347 isoform X9 [Zea mays]|eukprot:XP_020404070.1 uncharacterized protein LOC103647347 isoform X8 [Zea mays]
MTGAKQSRRCNLLTFFSTILATVLLLIFQRFSPTAAAVPQWRRGGTQEHIDVARGAEAVGHGQGRCEDSLRGGSSRWRRRRGFADGGRGTRVRLALQHAAVGNWYRLGTLRVLPHLLGNSDPDKLREKAAELVKLSAEELLKRQMEIKELMEKFKAPSDAELIKIAIADLNNSSLEDRQRALQELLILVEPIDNANGTWQCRRRNKNYFSMGAGQSQSGQCSCSKPDQWIWSFGQISEDGLFQFWTRSCKGRKRKSYIEHQGKSEVEMYQRVVCLQHILSTTNTSVRLQKK